MVIESILPEFFLSSLLPASHALYFDSISSGVPDTRLTLYTPEATGSSLREMSDSNLLFFFRFCGFFTRC